MLTIFGDVHFIQVFAMNLANSKLSYLKMLSSILYVEVLHQEWSYNKFILPPTADTASILLTQK